MKGLGFLVLLALVLLPSTVSADTFEYNGETYTFYPELGETQESITEAVDYILEGPPPPPDATNTDVWVDPFKAPVAAPQDDGGPSIADMNAAAFLDGIDWSGNEAWQWS
jgi:hypothetical protein